MNAADVAPVGLLPPLRERTVDGLWQRALRAVPDHAFLVTDEGEFAYSEAETHVAGVTRMLRDGGVAPGVHVAVLLDNSGWAADERFYTCLPLSHANALVPQPAPGDRPGRHPAPTG